MADKGYQTDFSSNYGYVFDLENRARKAKTMLTILSERLGDLSELTVLNIGGAAGGIDFTLADSVKHIVSLDIDENAISFAHHNHKKDNLLFNVGDGMNLPFADSQFDIIICSHVYEHVPDANQLMDEIYRVLSGKGVCYFAASNRMRVMEPHYQLPFLSIMPKFMANIFMRLAGKGSAYYEDHLWYWQLKKLLNKFETEEVTLKMVESPERYHIEYMIAPNSVKQGIVLMVYKYLKFMFPSYIWLLSK